MSQKAINTVIYTCNRCKKQIDQERLTDKWSQLQELVPSGLTIDLCDTCTPLFADFMNPAFLRTQSS